MKILFTLRLQKENTVSQYTSKCKPGGDILVLLLAGQ